jgi:hypothetical protein
MLNLVLNGNNTSFSSYGLKISIKISLLNSGAIILITQQLILAYDNAVL